MRYSITNKIQNNATLRSSFNRLAHQTFNIDFEVWFQKGYWGDTYMCHSITKDNQVLSNVSTTQMKLRLNGKEVSAIQIGTVMTSPEYRKMGFASELLKMVLNEYESKSDYLYLFPNASVMTFYPKFGFELKNDYKYSIQFKPDNIHECKLEKLNIENQNDLNKIYDYARNRHPLSLKFETLNSERILMWYCINFFSQNISYIKEFDAILIFDISDDVVNIYDIISPNKINLIELVDRISSGISRKVNFYFTPELEDNDFDKLVIQINEPVFVTPSTILFDNKIAYPITAHT